MLHLRQLFSAVFFLFALLPPKMAVGVPTGLEGSYQLTEIVEGFTKLKLPEPPKEAYVMNVSKEESESAASKKEPSFLVSIKIGNTLGTTLDVKEFDTSHNAYSVNVSRMMRTKMYVVDSEMRAVEEAVMTVLPSTEHMKWDDSKKTMALQSAKGSMVWKQVS